MSSDNGALVFLILGIIKLVHSNICFSVDSIVQRDKYMEHQVFSIFRSPSLYDCASICLMSSACLSFGFDNKTRTCLLNSNNSDAGTVVDRTGFLFSDIQHWPKSLTGRCSQRACPKTTRCEVTRLGSATCVPEFQGCGHPPVVRDATMTYDGHYNGAVATYSRYTCEQDFKVCHNNVTSTCQSSGSWETPAGLCERFRWHNPVEKTYSFPCGPTRGFQLIFKGTLTRRTRWGIGILKQGDVLFYSEFRYWLRGFYKKIALNTKLHGRWNRELCTDLTMEVGQESQVQITLQDGVYRLVIDGASIYNFTERDAGAKPDQFYFVRDVSVRMMKLMS
ncbi:uncharacterized protein [Haliotis cracherodii]|uniref:uncharacterized protein n=1 Tax=Haliotis cracherodii TaxID=6455 RepID=UPI0039E8BAEC